MFEIKTFPLSMLRSRLGTYEEQLPVEHEALVESLSVTSEHLEGPFIQLSYDEISDADIDRLLGYAGISVANSPVGLNADFSPRTFGVDVRDQVVLFPLAGLENHLRSEEPEIVGAFMRLGSMDAFAAEHGDAMTAVEYLIGGVLACVQFCKTGKYALVINW